MNDIILVVNEIAGLVVNGILYIVKIDDECKTLYRVKTENRSYYFPYFHKVDQADLRKVVGLAKELGIIEEIYVGETHTRLRGFPRQIEKITVQVVTGSVWRPFHYKGVEISQTPGLSPIP